MGRKMAQIYQYYYFLFFCIIFLNSKYLIYLLHLFIIFCNLQKITFLIFVQDVHLRQKKVAGSQVRAIRWMVELFKATQRHGRHGNASRVNRPIVMEYEHTFYLILTCMYGTWGVFLWDPHFSKSRSYVDVVRLSVYLSGLAVSVVDSLCMLLGMRNELNCCISCLEISDVSSEGLCCISPRTSRIFFFGEDDTLRLLVTL